MEDTGVKFPTYPYEVIKDHGGFVVRRNTALVSEIRAIKERVERQTFNSENGVLPKKI